MQLSGYLAIARRWWWTLLVATWVAAISGYLFASQVPPTYEARVRILVGPINTDTDTLRASGLLVQTYAELITSTPLLQSVISELGLKVKPSALQAATRATANSSDRYLTIRVQDGNPIQAAAIANGVADQLALLTSRGTTRPEGALLVTNPAEPPLGPIAPQVSLIVILAAVAGLLGALVLVMLLEYFSATVRTPDDVTGLTRLPFLGSVSVGSRTSRQLVVTTSPDSRPAAAYRLLAAKTTYGEADRRIRSLVLIASRTSDISAEIAANLAAVAAHSGRRVVLVDVDPDVGGVTTLFELEDEAGLSELLTDSQRPLRSSMVRVSPELDVVPQGSVGESDVVDADRASKLLERLLDACDLIVVSAGPVHRAASTLVWARAADSVIVVAERDQTKRDDLEYAVESLRQVGAKLAGAILNERRRSARPRRRSRPQAGQFERLSVGTASRIADRQRFEQRQKSP